MKKEIPKEELQIIRYLIGQLTGDDLNRFMDWLEAGEENRALFSMYQDIWNMEKVRHKLTDAVEKRDWDRLRSKLEAVQKPVIKLNPAGRPGFNRWLKVAAVFFMGFSISWLIFSVYSVDTSPTAVYNEVSTPLGSKSKIRLPDGSEVVLNAGSKLRYPQAFQKDSREVFLEGEAFFNVSHDAKCKFLVNTKDIAIKVYGTKFNVKAYASDKTVETTLVDGKVSVVSKIEGGRHDKKEILLKPNQRLVLYKQGGNGGEAPSGAVSTVEAGTKSDSQQPKLIVSRHVDPEYYTSWKDGRLIIRSERLEHLAVKLERRYDVHIHFNNDRVKEYRFTGIIENETVEQVFDAIRTASKINYRIEKRDVWIGD
jgi:ferric-dicitrate binding protein FerR (iron transport regulator)